MHGEIFPTDWCLRWGVSSPVDLLTLLAYNKQAAGIRPCKGRAKGQRRHDLGGQPLKEN